MDSEGRAEAMGRVGAGLGMVSLGLVVVIVNAVAAIGVVFALGETSKDPAAMLSALYRDHPSAVTMLIGLGVLSNVLAIAGKAFCLSIPHEAGATPFILLAVACASIGLALSVVGQLAEVGSATAEVTILSPLFSMCGFVFFLRFLRRLATYLGSARLLVRAARVQAGTVAIFVIYLLVSMGKAAGLADLVTVVVAMMLAVGAIVLFVWYATLVRDLRRAVETSDADDPA